MSDDTKLVKFEEEIKELASGDILHTPPSQLSPLEAVEAYAIVKSLKDALEARRISLRLRLLDDQKIIAAGKSTKTGGTKTQVRDHSVSRNRTTKRFANTDRVAELVAEKAIAEDRVYDDKTVVTIKKVVNPSKIEKLVEVGCLTDEEVESCHKYTWALVIKPSRELKLILDKAQEREAEDTESHGLLDFGDKDKKE
jgi:hypothetical protein